MTCHNLSPMPYFEHLNDKYYCFFVNICNVHTIYISRSSVISCLFVFCSYTVLILLEVGAGSVFQVPSAANMQGFFLLVQHSNSAQHRPCKMGSQAQKQKKASCLFSVIKNKKP